MESIQHVKPKNQYALIQDDIIRWAAAYTGPKFHAIFCDPPYHLTTITKRFGKPGSAPAKAGVYGRSSAGFMGQAWDGGGLAFNPETWAALTEHLYPGGFVMAFAGTRGYHRMACAMEDAGLIIHPAIGWTFLSGFPKATAISNQIDKAAGVEGASEYYDRYRDGIRRQAQSEGKSIFDGRHSNTRRLPATPLAQTWAGHRYGLQALKPAFEFIAVAQKPYEGRPIDCIVKTGAGALNIDGGRIPTGDSLGGGGYMTPMPEGWDRPWRHNEDIREEKDRLNDERVAHAENLGRWPANLILSHNPGCNGECEPDCPVKVLDEQSGERPVSGSAKNGRPATGDNYHHNNNVYGEGVGSKQGPLYNDEGGASRMFFQSDWQYEILEQLENAAPLRYEPKVSTAERSAGLEDPNHHPTLKPISLTKYLATLLLPPEAYAPRRLLVPFAGAGSEMIGAILAGWDEVTGIEQSADYVSIAEARLRWWSQWPGWGQTDADKILAAIEPNKSQAVQMELF